MNVKVKAINYSSITLIPLAESHEKSVMLRHNACGSDVIPELNL